MPDGNPVGLEIRNVHKRFPGVYAVNDVSLEAFRAEVTGLVGVNGAGKSTLMNILAGVLRPDSGEILVDGKHVALTSPLDAEREGIAFIQQEIQLFSSMTVYENVFLMNLRQYRKFRFLPFLDKGRLCEETKRLLGLLGCAVHPARKVATLSVGEQQMVQIARALSQGGKVLLFDEPTSSLSMKEKENLYRVIRSLKESGHTILFISHYLDEVQEICDSVVVLCDGKVSGAGRIAEMTKARITSLMMPSGVRREAPKKAASDEVILRVEGVSGIRKPRDVTFDLRKGEVLGLWGLLGSGRTETIRTILGLDERTSGRVLLKTNGELAEVSHRALWRVSGYVTEGRHHDGLFLSVEIWKNVTCANLEAFASRVLSILDSGREKEEGKKYIEKLRISAQDQFVKVSQLSGGNQQKVVIGKWLSKNPAILFLDEPTRGVDVGAKAEIQHLIKQLAAAGMACVVVTSEIEELQQLCDRVLVLVDGRGTCLLSSEESTNQRLIRECLGQQEAA